MRKTVSLSGGWQGPSFVRSAVLPPSVPRQWPALLQCPDPSGLFQLELPDSQPSLHPSGQEPVCHSFPCTWGLAPPTAPLSPAAPTLPAPRSCPTGWTPRVWASAWPRCVVYCPAQLHTHARSHVSAYPFVPRHCLPLQGRSSVGSLTPAPQGSTRWMPSGWLL